MANLELSKANKIKVLNSFPSSFVGKEGDLIISKISGKGKYLCAKVGGTWFAADKLNELNIDPYPNRWIAKREKISNLISSFIDKGLSLNLEENHLLPTLIKSNRPFCNCLVVLEPSEPSFNSGARLENFKFS